MHFHSFIHSFVRSFIHSSVSSSIKHLLKICHTLDTVLDPEDTATRRTQKSLPCLYHVNRADNKPGKEIKYTICCVVVSTVVKKKAGKAAGVYTRDVHP